MLVEKNGKMLTTFFPLPLQVCCVKSCSGFLWLLLLFLLFVVVEVLVVVVVVVVVAVVVLKTSALLMMHIHLYKGI
jgi:hypothetical protein